MIKYVIASILIVSVSITMHAQSDPEGLYGSLAIDARDGEMYGWAINYSSRSEAEKRALAECEKKGGNCMVVLTFNGGCGAYVVERGNPSLYGWGVASSRAEAEEIAVTEARKQGGDDLLVRVWGCNDTDLYDVYDVEPMTGLYMFQTSISDTYKTYFYTDIYYEENTLVKEGDTYSFSNDASQKFMPYGERFAKKVEAYYAQNYDRDITYTPYWDGVSLVPALNRGLKPRGKNAQLTLVKSMRAKLIENKKEEGYKVIYIPI